MAFDDRHIEPLIAIALVGIGTGAGTPIIQRCSDVSTFVAVLLALFSSVGVLAAIVFTIWWRER